MLLVSIHLREKQLEQIEDLITNTLSMKVSVRTYSVRQAVMI